MAEEASNLPLKERLELQSEILSLVINKVSNMSQTSWLYFFGGSCLLQTANYDDYNHFSYRTRQVILKLKKVAFWSTSRAYVPFLCLHCAWLDFYALHEQERNQQTPSVSLFGFVRSVILNRSCAFDGPWANKARAVSFFLPAQLFLN